MKKQTKLVLAVALALGAVFTLSAQQTTLTGTLTDSMCGTTHMAKEKTPGDCTRMCVKDGMKYELAADSKLYTLEGHESELSKLAGQKITVQGTLKDNTLTVNSVAPAK